MPRGRRVTALPLVDPGSSGEPRERETRLWKASPEFSSGRTHCAAGSSQQGAPGTLYPHGTCHVQAGGSGVRLGARGPRPSASLCTRPPHSPEERPSRDDVTEALGPAKRCRSLQNHHTRVHADSQVGTLGLGTARKKRHSPPPQPGLRTGHEAAAKPRGSTSEPRWPQGLAADAGPKPRTVRHPQGP